MPLPARSSSTPVTTSSTVTRPPLAKLRLPKRMPPDGAGLIAGRLNPQFEQWERGLSPGRARDYLLMDVAFAVTASST